MSDAMMSPSVRKIALTTHVVASVGWLGALLAFFAHAVASVASDDATIVRAASLAMGLTAWGVILPLSLLSTFSGIVQALGTAWGLFRHYWVVMKLLITVVATGVLLLKLAPISYLREAAAAATFTPAELFGLRISLLVHAGAGAALLLAAATLAIFKPVGLTPFGAPDRTIPTPRWVKVSMLLAAVVLLLIVIMMLGGQHSPSAHM